LKQREPRVLARPDHRISRKEIAPSALRVLYRLNRAGFEAYLVGGSVRDLLLGIRPKDFDVATDARPEQVRRLFRNSRIIGRRFRLVHVIFPDGIIEVSTFRADPDPRRQARRPGELLVTSDNTYGDPEDDAFRRDFTVNALYYRIHDFSVIDYTDGLRDLENRQMRVIGDPDLRFKEDPVRMLRACELAGRLDFDIDEQAQVAIQEHAREILKAAPARLYEELMQLLASGQSDPAFIWMADLGLLEILFPEACELAAEEGTFAELLPTLDAWISEGRQPGDTVLLALLLAPELARGRAALEVRAGGASREELQELVSTAVAAFGTRLGLAHARASELYWLFETFQRLCEPIEDYEAAVRLGQRPAFAQALELFELLVEATDAGAATLDRWREIARVAAHAPQAPRPRRRRRRPRRR
jgi:poly(A) polymerase